MSEMDLIPGDYRQNLNKHRLFKKFLMVCVCMLCCIGLAKMLLTYLIWRENVQVVRLEQQEDILKQNNAKTDSFRQQKHVTEQQLAALNELRGRDRVVSFLHAVDVAYSEGIWFDRIHLIRQSKTDNLNGVPGGSGANIAGNPNEVVSTTEIDFSQNVEIIGHAVNHSLLAEFMRTLGTQPSITDLRLIDTDMRNYTTVQVVDFNLALEMNGQKKDTKGQIQP